MLNQPALKELLQYKVKVYWIPAKSPGRPATVRGPYTFDEAIDRRLYWLKERPAALAIGAAFRAETSEQARRQAALHFPQ
ncbi:MAG: hypothetical protein JWN70_3621 [Planctomycetaceae bacterium]|nr:hypothetical protein [Planctomycetaceae bacterium]